MFGIWPIYEGSIQGVIVSGDKSVPPTKWWNHLWLRFFGWKMVTVLCAENMTSLRIGYRPLVGKPRISPSVYNISLFAVRNGHEDCTFFAVDLEGREVALTVRRQTSLDQLGAVPLL